MDYTRVKEELAKGTPAELICATCPWDRLCVNPPSISAAEVDRRIAEAEAKDKERDPKAMPTSMLITALAFGGRDSTSQVCPVFARRLGGPDGRRIADTVRALMRDWDGEG